MNFNLIFIIEKLKNILPILTLSLDKTEALALEKNIKLARNYNLKNLFFVSLLNKIMQN